MMHDVHARCISRGRALCVLPCLQMEAQASKAVLVEEVGQGEAALAGLAAFIGEPASCDHANLLAAIWTLACAFDRAFCHVQQSLLSAH